LEYKAVSKDTMSHAVQTELEIGIASVYESHHRNRDPGSGTNLDVRISAPASFLGLHCRI